MAVNLSRITTFNTGRGYTDKGQRIACTELPNGRVMFADVDRHIDGVTHNEFNQSWKDCGFDIKEFVMMEYDHGRIDYGAWGIDPGKTERENLDNVMRQLWDAAKAI